jgi:hypothetical protein
MHKHTKKLMIASSLGFMILGGHGFARELFSDEFPGTTFDPSKWVRSSFADVGITASNGVLRLPVTGWHHYNGLYTHQTDFDFFEGAITVEIDMVAYDQPTWGTGDSMSAELWFAFGPAQNRNPLRDPDPAVSGFSVALRWSPDGTLDLYSPSIPLESQPVTQVPDKIYLSVDAEGYTITLEGAAFVDGGDSVSGLHSVEPLPEYRFFFLQELRGYLGNVMSTFNSIRISTDAARTQWAHYPVEDSWVDTGSWLGLLYVEETPWIFSDRYQLWIYLREGDVFEYGAWLYAPL